MTSTPNYKAERVGVFGHPVAENPTCVTQDAVVNPRGKKALVLAGAFGQGGQQEV